MIKLNLLFSILFVFFLLSVKTQELEFFWDTESSIECQRVQEDENGDYVIIGNMYDTADHYSAYILKLDSSFDTTRRIIENSYQDILFQDFIVLPDNEYFVIGTIGKDIGNKSNVNDILIIKYDENLNVIFEKQYSLGMSNTYWGPDIKILQNHGNEFYVHARFNQSEMLGGDYNQLMRLNNSGDTIKTRSYISLYSLGLSDIYSIMNSNGNIDGIYGTATGFSSFSPLQMLEIDTNLNIEVHEIDNIGGEIFQFSPRFTTKWLNDSIYLLLNSEKQNNSSTLDIFLSKFNSSHEYIGDPIWVGRPDTNDWVPRYGMDWTDPNNIFLCAYQFVYHVPWEVSQLVALVDSDLNIKGMKNYGKDLNFGIWTICATSDGGAVIPSAHHDYNNPHIDNDLIIWKISSDDIITSAAETLNPYDSDYLVFPNPGGELLNIQTARKGVKMEIYNEIGTLILEFQLSDSYLNKVNTSTLRTGNYIYKFTDDQGYSESGKWIKTQ